MVGKNDMQDLQPQFFRESGELLHRLCDPLGFQGDMTQQVAGVRVAKAALVTQFSGLT